MIRDQVILLFVLLVHAIPVYASTQCAELLKSEAPTYTSLSPADFDLKPAMGWRKLYDSGCNVEAAKAVELYLMTGNGTYHVYFHGAQLDAKNGNYQEALRKLRKATRPELTEDSPFKWNEYVKALAAFLEGDLDSLLIQRALVAARQDVKGNVANLAVIDKMTANFGQPYGSVFK